MIQNILEGKPFGHPVHPAIVHFPIGLFIFSLLFDLATLFEADLWLVLAAFYTMIGGVATALLAAIFGFADYLDIRDDHPDKNFATWHMGINLTVVGFYVVNLLLRYNALDVEATPILPFILSLIGVGLLFVSGYLGGHLIYNAGIAVGRHRRHTETPEETIRVSSPGGAGGFVAVAPADRLDEGETLRAEVDGTVMTIARINGDYYAFQEFCTHRFGPLSEGHFEGYNVMCPWHRSCFDVRTGKVTQGPAKVDLKSFPVTVENGEIRVKVIPS